MGGERPKIYLTDGEGPVVFKDLARDISLKSLPKHQFDIMSMWVAHDTEKPVPVLEPGDTLSLVVPHLIVNGVTNEDLVAEATHTTVAPGIIDHLKNLRLDGWSIGIISTAYQQLWEVSGKFVNVPLEDISCTKTDLDQFAQLYIDGRVRNAIKEAEYKLERSHSAIRMAVLDFKNGASLPEIFDNKDLKSIDELLTELYFSRLPQLGLAVTSATEVVGGNRKVEMVIKVAESQGAEIDDVVYVGDSITDDKAHKFVKENGGLSIASNGDEFAIRNACVAIATNDMREIKPIVDAWVSGGINEVNMLAKSRANPREERSLSPVDKACVVSVVNRDNLQGTIDVHREYRKAIKRESMPLL